MWYTYIKWLSNSYSNKLSLGFNNCRFDTINEVVLTKGWRCSILWLPIGIFYGAKCECEYTFGCLLLI